MNDGGSVVEFFFNIIPGILLLVFLQRFFDITIIRVGAEEGGLVIIFLYIVLGLFIGFFFQAITKLFRDMFDLNQKIADKVKKNNEEIYSKAVKSLKAKGLSSKDYIYLMDSSLRSQKPAFLPTHFSSRFAFWTNLFIGGLVLFVIYVFRSQNNCSYTLFYLSFLSFSAYMSYGHFVAYYDTIVKSYYAKRINK